MTESSAEAPDDRHLDWTAMWQEAVRSSRSVIGLLDLSTARFIELSDRAAELLGTTAQDGIGLSLPSVMEPPREASESFRLLRRGIIDGMRARRRLRRPDGSRVGVQVCGWAIRSSVGPDLGLWTAWEVQSTEAEAGGCLVVASFRKGPAPLLEGDRVTVDRRWIVKHVAATAGTHLGGAFEELVGRSFIELTHPDDFAALLFALARATTDSSAHARVRLRHDDGTWRETDVVPTIVYEDPSTPAAFVLKGDDPDEAPSRDALTQAPERLRRIADQIEAANVLRPLAQMAGALGMAAATDLSPRQWEIVSRLLQGQRVPRIAADLYLSASTVRNHLSAVFAKAGVHSQDELVALYRRNRGDRASNAS